VPYCIVLCCAVRCGTDLCEVGGSPAVSKELGDVSETKLSALLSTATMRHIEPQQQNSSVTRLLARTESDADCGLRKHARKSRLCVKNEHGPESVGKTAHHRHYHRPPTPDTSPIHLLPFSPSQVAHTTFIVYLYVETMTD